MASASKDQAQAFWYVASAPDGQSITGTIDAAGVDEASHKLRSLQLQVVELKPTARPRPAQLRGEDFLAFNQQLAQLAAAGLPVEQGLRLIAQDMQSGRLAQTLKQVADDLDRGKSLPQAIDASRGKFPPLYARLIDAGIRSGNLPGTLLNLGRHLTLLRQLRTAIWRTAAYPLMVLIAAGAVLVFISFTLIPQIEPTFRDFHIELPVITEFILSAAALLRSPMLWMIVGVLVIAVVITWILLRATGRDREMMGRMGLMVPLIGPVIRKSLISRWCDAMRLGVEAGLDLPGSISMAGDVIDAPALKGDGAKLIEMLSAGGNLEQAQRGRVLPLTVVKSIQLAAERNDLARTLGMLSEMYQQQAQARMDALAGLLAPLLLVILGGVIAFIALALFAPLINLFETVSGPTHWR